MALQRALILQEHFHLLGTKKNLGETIPREHLDLFRDSYEKLIDTVLHDPTVFQDYILRPNAHETPDKPIPILILINEMNYRIRVLTDDSLSDILLIYTVYLFVYLFEIRDAGIKGASDVLKRCVEKDKDLITPLILLRQDKKHVFADV